MNCKLTTVLFCFVAALLCLALPSPANAEASGKRLNVLMIAVDDLRPELGCYGQSYMHTPHIDALAASGVRFDRAYCQVAVCGASRASLMSGCRPETTGCWDYKTLMRSKMPHVLSLPQHFRQQGYQTTFIGKIYHSGKDDPQGWSLSADDLAPRDPKKGKGYMNTPYHKRISHPGNPKLKHGPASENGGDAPDDAYTDGHNADRALMILKALADRKEPFFFGVGFLKPHLPFNAPGKYWDLYDRNSIEIPARKDVVDGVPYAGSSWGELKNYPDIPRDVRFLDDAKSKELIHGYRAAVSYTDAQVGKLIAGLEQLGLRENTIVVLWGDHGWYVGDFGQWCKHTNYEIATRVPLIVSAPGGKALATQGLTEFVDLYPTLCEMTGLSIPDHCQGKSFVSLLETPDIDWKEAAFSQYKKRKGRATMLGTSIRTSRFRYTQWRDDQSGKLDAIELIDFEKDPEATRNVAADPAYADQMERLAELCAQSGSGV